MQKRAPERRTRNRRETVTQREFERPAGSRQGSESRPTRRDQDGEARTTVEFQLVAGLAQSVAVAGSFNGWDAKKHLLKRDGDYWTGKVTLPRGRHEYRFVVDGAWISDPAAKESVANPFGGSNSVVNI